MTRILGWFALITGVLTTATAFALPWFSEQPFSLVALVALSALGLATVVGGYFGLRGNAWAFWLLFVVFLVQCVEYFSDTFYFSFMGPLAVKVGWGWYSPPSRVNLNLLAIAVCAMSIVAARGLTPGRTDGP